MLKDWMLVLMAGASKDEPRQHFWCKRCDARHIINLPTALSTFIALGDAFEKLHSFCGKDGKAS